MDLLKGLTRVTNARTKRQSSWDRTGRNLDAWTLKDKSKAVLAGLKGPGCITHIWMTQFAKEKSPSVMVPLGDFFCLGHSMVNSFCSLPFTASTNHNNKFDNFVALNCYLQMPFNRRARIEIESELSCAYDQYFHVDYELYDKPHDNDAAYFHAQWNRENPCDGWAHEIEPNAREFEAVNLDGKGNYVILDAKGKGHYIGCNLSVTNFRDDWWWGEGDDMIFIDGEKWPPSLHGTGSEDYLNQAYGMQDNKFLFNGSSIHENNTGGYQTSYVFHIPNPVRFQKDIRVTIEHGHANHLSNEYASTAYWYQQEPHKPFDILPMSQRLPVGKKFVQNSAGLTPVKRVKLNKEMIKMKKLWKKRMGK